MIFRNLVAIFGLAISQPNQYVNPMLKIQREKTAAYLQTVKPFSKIRCFSSKNTYFTLFLSQRT